MTETAIGARRGVPVTAEEEMLTRAASRIRTLGEKATPGPWSRAMKTRTKSAIMAPTPDDAENYMLGREHVAICSVPHFDGGGGFLRKRSGRDLDWIVAMNPAVASALADVLDRAARARWARDVALQQVPGASLSYEPWTDDALVVARALLGEDGSS